MQPGKKLILTSALVIAAFLAILFGLRRYDEWRTERDERALRELPVVYFTVKDATLTETMEAVVQSVHALGRRDVRVTYFATSGELPEFHPFTDRRPPGHSGQRISLTLTGIPLEDLLKYVGTAADATCEVRGHELVVVPSRGTAQHFRRVTLKLEPEFFDEFPDRTLARWASDQGLATYEGMKVEFRRKQSEVEVYAPESEINQLKSSFGNQLHRDGWERMEAWVTDWRKRLLGF